MKTRKIVNRTVCTIVPVEIALICGGIDTTESPQLFPELKETLRQMYCNNIIPIRGTELQDDEIIYTIKSVSYSYRVNDGDSYIQVNITLN